VVLRTVGWTWRDGGNLLNMVKNDVYNIIYYNILCKLGKNDRKSDERMMK